MTQKTKRPVRCTFDHLVITAPSLASGIAHVQRTLGVEPGGGGTHERMGTHNALMSLGDSAYLEIIAVNPAMPAPDRARWFGLDGIDDADAPRLATWVARTTNIQAAVDSASIPLGDIVPMSRGHLKWFITIPPDGSMPFGGVAPAFIQWETTEHPASRLPDEGCSLVSLEGFHPQASVLNASLRALGVGAMFSVESLPPKRRPYLVAYIQTPLGVRQLSGL